MAFINKKAKGIGSLVALACGDSYGRAYETDGLAGAKWPAASLPEAPAEPEVTDDTKMAAILLRHYKRYGCIDIKWLMLSYRFWAKEEGAKDGIGIQTAKVLLGGSLDKSSQGNGALMRSIPLEVHLVETGHGFDEAVEMMNTDAAITHDNETVFMANRLALDLALNGTAAAGKAEYAPLLKRLKPGHTAWVVHSLYAVLSALENCRGFLDGFKYLVAKGGDTDTNCAIYGAILGATKTVSEELALAEFLPEHFFDTLEELSQPA